MISLKQLAYALAVEKHLHFRKAAESCHVSQSALSIALTELEKNLGLQLFERDNKKVLITPEGQLVLEKARNVMLQISEIEHLADIQKAPLSFPISIGMIPTIAPYLLPKLLPVLEAQYPQLELSVVEEQSHVLVDQVRRGDIDTAILALPFPCDGLLSFEFWQEDFYWITHKDNAPHKRQEVASKELANARLMLLSEGHCLKDHALEACKLAPTEQAHGFGASSLNTLVQMVIGKLGTTLIPEMALEQLTTHHAELLAVHVNEPGPHRRLAFIVRPNYSRLSSIEALKALCQGALAEPRHTE